jgi:GNAT superfamily N-acetyltransferase
MYELKIVKSQDTYVVRHPVLRKGRPIETCRFEGDDLNSTTHFGLFSENELIAVTSVFVHSHESLEYEIQFQLRGMAVLDAYQSKGIGKILLTAVINELKKQHVNFCMWFNARTSAVGFYEKMNFKKYGDAFEIVPIGPHYVMFQEFNSDK